MPKSLTHKFVSGIADGADPTVVRPQSNWNDDHNFWLGRRSVAVSTDTIAHADHLTIIKYTVTCAVSLPAPTGGNMPTGWQTRLVNVGSGVVTIAFTGGATINGSASSVPLNPGDMIELLSDASADYLGIIETSGGAASFLQPGVTNTITVGYRFTPNNLGNIATPFTPNPALGNYQFGINHVAATWNIPANDCAMDILVTNDGTAGAITFAAGYAGGLTGDPLTTTDKSTATVTCTSASPGVITWTAHGLQNGDPVYLTATTSVPTGFTSGTVYYVNNRATNTFELAATPGGTSINTTSTGSGTITGHACSRFVISLRRINMSSMYSVRALQ